MSSKENKVVNVLSQCTNTCFYLARETSDSSSQSQTALKKWSWPLHDCKGLPPPCGSPLWLQGLLVIHCPKLSTFTSQTLIPDRSRSRWNTHAHVRTWWHGRVTISTSESLQGRHSRGERRGLQPELAVAQGRSCVAAGPPGRQDPNGEERLSCYSAGLVGLAPLASPRASEKCRLSGPPGLTDQNVHFNWIDPC